MLAARSGPDSRIVDCLGTIQTRFRTKVEVFRTDPVKIGTVLVKMGSLSFFSKITQREEYNSSSLCARDMMF